MNNFQDFSSLIYGFNNVCLEDEDQYSDISSLMDEVQSYQHGETEFLQNGNDYESEEQDEDEVLSTNIQEQCNEKNIVTQMTLQVLQKTLGVQFNIVVQVMKIIRQNKSLRYTLALIKDDQNNYAEIFFGGNCKYTFPLKLGYYQLFQGYFQFSPQYGLQLLMKEGSSATQILNNYKQEQQYQDKLFLVVKVSDIESIKGQGGFYFTKKITVIDQNESEFNIALYRKLVKKQIESNQIILFKKLKRVDYSTRFNFHFQSCTTTSIWINQKDIFKQAQKIYSKEYQALLNLQKKRKKNSKQ